MKAYSKEFKKIKLIKQLSRFLIRKNFRSENQRINNDIIKKLKNFDNKLRIEKLNLKISRTK